MPHAIRIHEVGGPEVLQWEEVDVGEPGPGQVRLRQEAVGLNFIDVYHREGRYPAKLPFVIGQEGAGTVAGVGSEVRDFRPGERVAVTAVALALVVYVLCIPVAWLVARRIKSGARPRGPRLKTVQRVVS